MHKIEQAHAAHQISSMRTALATITNHITYKPHAPPLELLIDSNIRKHMDAGSHWFPLPKKSQLSYPNTPLPYANVWLRVFTGCPYPRMVADSCQLTYLLLPEWRCPHATTNIPCLPHVWIASLHEPRDGPSYHLLATISEVLHLTNRHRHYVNNINAARPRKSLGNEL